MEFDNSVISWEMELLLEPGGGPIEFKVGTFQQLQLTYMEPLPPKPITIVTTIAGGKQIQAWPEVRRWEHRIAIVPGYDEKFCLTAGDNTQPVKIRLVLRQIY